MNVLTFRLFFSVILLMLLSACYPYQQAYYYPVDRDTSGYGPIQGNSYGSHAYRDINRYQNGRYGEYEDNGDSEYDHYDDHDDYD